MNVKSIAKWSIVLFLLAALPVMTAVMAQGQEPVVKQLPVVTEPGESSAIIAWNRNESEPNNTPATANARGLNDVVRGWIDYEGDIDYFYIGNASWVPAYVMIDIEAWSIGSALDSLVCVHDQYGNVRSCNDDSDTLDSLLVYGGFWFSYISVTDLSDDGGNNYEYRLIMSSPLLVSADAKNLRTGNVAGISFNSADILAHSDLATGDEKWVMFFDASDVGITKNVSNVAFHDYPEFDGLLLGFSANQYISDLSVTATPYDYVVFDAVKYGPETEGVFTEIFRGREHLLTTSGEKLDALDHKGICYLGTALSTVGAANVGSYELKHLKDEDVFCWQPVDQWYRGAFYGRNVEGLAAEDVQAVAFGGRNQAYLWYLTILGNGNIAGHNVTQKDIFAIHGTTNVWGGVAWHGPDHGWNYNIDAIEWDGW